MKYKKLVTLGCSLAPLDGWANAVKERFNISDENHAHYGFGGGDNVLTLTFWHEYFCQNSLEDTLVIWELTGLNRFQPAFIDPGFFKNLKNSQEWDNDNAGSWLKFKTFFGNKNKFGVWGQTLGELKDDDSQVRSDYCLLYSQLVTTISSIPCDTVVFRGWSSAIPEDYWIKSIPIFERNNVIVIKKPYTDWVLENDLPVGKDGWHPSSASGIKFAHKILLKAIDKQ